MNNILAKKLYILLQAIRKEPVFHYLKEMKQNELLNRSELQNIQKKRTIDLLIHAYNNSPYYKNLFDSKNIDIHSFSNVEDLKYLPILTKKDIQKNASTIIVNNFKGLYSTAKTAGSTGVPLKFKKDRVATGVHNACFHRGLSWHGIDVGMKEGMLWGLPLDKIPFYKMQITDFLLNRFKATQFNFDDATLKAFYFQLIKRKPIFLSGYSSMIYEFSLFLKKNSYDGRRLGLKIVKATSENIYDEYYDLIKEVFGCPLVCEYGAAETGIVAFSCEFGNIHLMSDFVLTEFIEPQEPIIEGAKELIITPLCNYSFPIIRYQIGDFGIESTRECPCGRKLPLIKKIIGRSKSLIQATNGRKVHSIFFNYVFKGLANRFDSVDKFQVVQTEINKIELRLMKNHKFDENSVYYINQKIKEKLGEEMQIDYSFTQRISRENSGKFKEFISKIT